MSIDGDSTKGRWTRFTALLGGLLLSCLALEFGYRALSALGALPSHLSLSAERLAAFREHVDSGVRGMFAPKAFVGYTLQGEGSNLDGFCDRDWDASKPPGVIRIACLGGSTTQDGCMTDRTNTYSSFLSRMMNRRLQADVEVLNFGVNGWTSAESLVNYALVVSHYQPDFVVIHHAVNDVWPRLYPGYRSDFTHYRVPWQDAQLSSWDKGLIAWSTLWAAVRIQDRDLVGIRERVIRRESGQPVELGRELSPQTIYGYRANLQRLCRLVKADGAVPVLMTMPYSAEAGGLGSPWLTLLETGTEEHNEIIRGVAQDEEALLADAAYVFQSDPDEHDKFFIDYVHLRAAGNRVKALLIAEALQQTGLGQKTK